jgi:hypothetical protein
MSVGLTLPDIAECKRLAAASRVAQGLPASLQTAAADVVASVLNRPNSAAVTTPCATPSRPRAQATLAEVAQ